MMPVRAQIEVKEVEPGTREAFWREAIVAWADSGLAQVEFCRLRGLDLARFRRYRTKLTRRAQGAGDAQRGVISSTPLAVREAVSEFVEVQLATAPTSGPVSLEVMLANGRRIGVRAGFDREALRAVVGVLESC
jgi:hypothetical protein